MINMHITLRIELEKIKDILMDESIWDAAKLAIIERIIDEMLN